MADSTCSVCLKNAKKNSGNSNSVIFNVNHNMHIILQKGRENHSKTPSSKLIQASMRFCEDFSLRCGSVVSPL